MLKHREGGGEGVLTLHTPIEIKPLCFGQWAMSKLSIGILYGELLYKIGNYFLDIQYVNNTT